MVIILTYSILDDEEYKKHSPRLVFVDKFNKIQKTCLGRYE
ncbi:MAG: aspartate 1-decarboxylase [Syntrophomonadaceae bacterium]|nr:aspartate 1-decarboxylase [Syntrophomonadaceae bacterium]